MTLSSPQLVPVVPPLDIRVSATGTFFVLILPEPDDLEWFEELLKGTGAIEANREFLIWKRIWIKEERGYYDPWELEKFLQEAWLEIHEIDPEPPPMLALPPAPPEVGKGTRGLIDMAREMQLDPGELESRLESGNWNYVVTKRVSADGFNHRQTEGYKGVWTCRHEYFFNMPDAKHNVANVEVPGRVKIRKDVGRGEE